MDPQYAYNLNYMIPRKGEPLPLFPPRTAIHRPFSEETEIFEDEVPYDNSPMRSVASFGAGSTSTLSTPDNIRTPNSTGLTSFDFHIDDKNVQGQNGKIMGPSGPHLFSSSSDSDFQSSLGAEMMMQETPISITGPFHHQASKFDPWRRDTPVPDPQVASTPQPQYQPNYHPQQQQQQPPPPPPPPQQQQLHHQPKQYPQHQSQYQQQYQQQYSQQYQPQYQSQSQPQHEQQQLRQPQYAPSPERIPAFRRLSTADWSPDEVVQWMQSLGFDDEIRQTFYKNDISGLILLELQSEDLKELDIASFGKRHRLMSSIHGLRGGSSVSSSAGSTAPSSSRNSSVSSDRPSTAATSAVMSLDSHPSHNSYQSVNSQQPLKSHHSHNSYQSQSSTQSCSTTDEECGSVQKTRRRRQRSSPEVRNVTDIQPGDSVSIVAIEQLLPKPHNCSKGEDCRKWQKQAAKIARLAQDLPIEAFNGRAIVAGDPGNPKTAPNLLKVSTKSEVPSLVASSDALGPRQPGFHLSQDKLNEVQPRDPQENVRNFLNFQSLSKLKTANDPATPPREHLASPTSESPSSAKITPTLAENLGRLPRLMIPSMHASERSAMSESMSALKTVTPSILTKHNRLYANDRTAIPVRQKSETNGNYHSPGDYYRMDPCYRQETPFSETDAPVTAVPIGPAREESQSAPPGVQIAELLYANGADPIPRPSTTSTTASTSTMSTMYTTCTAPASPAMRGMEGMEGHRRHLSNSNLNPLREGRVLSPIETPDDLRRVARAPHFRSGKIFNAEGDETVTHSGPMKKRKTTKLLRHEWEDGHFTLKGTQLSMHADENASRRHSKALEYIDVDDYAVACSSLASNSKLTAAFKKTILKRRDSAPGNSAFSFSLIPAANHNGGIIDRKTMFLNSGKTHHFAVKSRDQRIDWMRELMLAKALKRGRQAGAAVNMNGNMF